MMPNSPPRAMPRYDVRGIFCTHVDNTYSHACQDGQGHTLATSAPLSAGNVNWQELQQVELKNY